MRVTALTWKKRSMSPRPAFEFRATQQFWRKFYALSANQKESVRAAWARFKINPSDPLLGTHKIHSLSSRATGTSGGHFCFLAII